MAPDVTDTSRSADPVDPLRAPRLDGEGPGEDAGNTDEVIRPRRRGRVWRELALVLVVALVLAVVLRTFVMQTFTIPTPSMEPTLMIGDHILVDKLSYHLHGVGYGDIVVFRRPPHLMEPSDEKDIVKRVVGLPGQRIASAPNGDLIIDGHVKAEPWLSPAAREDPGPPIMPQTIPAGHYFVMGDNRGISEDSREFGPISRSLIIGRVVMRIWPLSALHVF